LRIYCDDRGLVQRIGDRRVAEGISDRGDLAVDRIICECSGHGLGRRGESRHGQDIALGVADIDQITSGVIYPLTYNLFYCPHAGHRSIAWSLKNQELTSTVLSILHTGLLPHRGQRIDRQSHSNDEVPSTTKVIAR
jgi:hypothetical protein